MNINILHHFKHIILTSIVFTTTVYIAVAQTYIIGETTETVTTDNGYFYDSGGETGQYSNSEHDTLTFIPATEGYFISCKFLSFAVEQGCDYLYIYDGTTTDATLIGSYTGTDISTIGDNGIVTAAHANGALTFVFSSDGGVVEDGWKAEISITTREGISAFFSADASSSSTFPFTVNFTDESVAYTGDVSSWAWDFDGDEITDKTEQNPSYTYTAPGFYSVTLIAGNGTTYNTLTVDNYISCGIFIMGDATGTITTDGGYFYDSGGKDGQYNLMENYTLTFMPETQGNFISCQFLSLDVYSTDLLYIYDGTSTDATLIGSYSGSDIAAIGDGGVVTATNADGALTFNFFSSWSTPADGWEAEITTSTPTEGLSANFSANATSSSLPFTVNFTDESVAYSGEINSWAWDFDGDGITDNTEQNPSYTYSTQGIYSVRLIAGNGTTLDTLTKEDFITAGEVFLMGTTTGTVTTEGGYFYDSGGNDGQYSNNEDYTLTFMPATAIKTVSCQFLSFNVENSYDYLEIYDGTSTDATLIGRFDGSDASAIGDNGLVTATNVSGALTFKFYSDNSGTKDGWVAEITTQSRDGLYATFSADATSSKTLPFTVNFTDESVAFSGEINSWAWDFNGDGITDNTEQNPSYTYTDVGTYSVTLIAGNGTTLYTRTMEDFITTGDTFLLGSTTDTVVTYGGYFYDSGGENEQYSSKEDYTVTFIPANEGYNVISCKILSFASEQDQDYLEIYDGTSTDAPSLGYASGTDASGIEGNGIATATNTEGALTVRFVSDDWNQADGWKAKITVLPHEGLAADFSARTRGSSILPFTVDFTDKTIAYSGEVNFWAWDFDGDGIIDNTEQNPSFTYTTAGLYPVTLVAGNGTTFDTLTVENYVLAGLTDYIMGNSPDTVITDGGYFYDSGGDNDTYNNNEDYTLTFLPATDGEYISCQFLSFLVESSYDYLEIYNGTSTDATLIGHFEGTDVSAIGSNGVVTATNADGALTFKFYSDGGGYDDGWKAKISTKTGVSAAFVTNKNSTLELSLTVNFTDESVALSGEINSWEWDFDGDGITDNTEQNPTYTYSTAGIYSVTLIAGNGTTKDTLTMEDYISVGQTDYIMGSTPDTIITDEGYFYDSGGENGEYRNNEDYTLTFMPATEGTALSFQFLSFELYDGADYLEIYDGTSTNATLIGKFIYTDVASSIGSEGKVTATNASGALTFKFHSGESFTKSGWKAEITTIGVSSAFTIDKNCTLTLPFTVNFTDESVAYVGEINSWKWDFNGDGITDATEQNPSYTYTANGAYSVTLITGNGAVFDTITMDDYITIGHAIMGNTQDTVIVDNGYFYDSGGEDGKYRNDEDYTVTFMPATEGKAVSCEFLSFVVEFFCDYLQIYDGASTDAPLIGQYDEESADIGTNWKVIATNASGALTFRFYSDFTDSRSGWKAKMTTVDVSAEFSVDKHSSLTVPFTVNFTDLSTAFTDPINSWEWDFDGDGIIDNTEQNPSYTYTTKGVYPITLIVGNGSEQDTLTKEDFIAPGGYILQDDDVVVENNVIISCSYDFLITDIIIPDTLDGQAVFGTADGSSLINGVFYNKDITSINLPATIDTIGFNSFCTNDITTLDLSKCSKLTYIDDYAFYGNSLTSVDLSGCSSLNYIGSRIFNDNSLTSFTLPANEIYDYYYWKDGVGNTYVAGDEVNNLNTNYYVVGYYFIKFIDWNNTELKVDTLLFGGNAIPPADPVREGYTFTGWDTTYTNITEGYNVTAQYEINTYTITFKDWDNSVLKRETVEYGSDATAPDDPVRVGYTFTGWDTTFTNITESYDVTAQYEINPYTITFKDWDNSVLKTDNVEYGSDATAPDAPVRVGYTFTGWDTTYTNITEGYNVTAQYEINTYTITFKDWDNSVLKRETVEYGSDATAPDDPVRVGYTFTGWDTTFTNITESYDVTAQYEINTYTITFKDWDNSVLKTDNVEYGSDATAPDAPVRVGYTFTGWDTTFTNITESYDVTAQYEINTYTITFKDWDNSVLKTDNVEYGSDATAPDAPVRVGYTFTGWDTTFTNITESYDVTAQYEINTYTITFKDWDNSVLKTDNVEYGSDATAPDDPVRVGYTFSGWDTTFTNITESYDVTAQYEINTYTITFKDWDNSVLKTDNVEYGSDATAPDDPVRVGYTFTGWDTTFTNITESYDVTAQYEINTYTITFKDWDNSVLKTDNVEYGSDATAPDDPVRVGYTFSGWDTTFTNITESYDVTAQYEINTYTITFKDWDNSVLKTDNVEYGSDATAPDDPVRVGYTFTGWDTTFTNITESYDVTAQYEINTYTITFKDWDNSVLKTDNVEYGSDATAPTDPVREGYTFTGWDTTFTNITESYDVTAQYEINTYTITFKDWDNSVLKTDNVEYGSDATAPDDPVRVGYTFTGWDATFTNITESYDVTAQYEINTYIITFKDWDNSVLKRDTVEYGSDATAPDDPVREGYIFTGWDATFTNITESYDVTAQYEINTYTITFKDWDNSVLKTDNVEYGSDATAPDDPVRVGYTFTGWDTTFTNITESYDVTAQYEINTYIITFKDWDNSVLKTDNVEYGSDATAPTDPVREGYTFTGWDTTFTNITESYDVTAQYEINTYTITFKDWDNSVLKTDNVEYGSDATAPDDPVRVGYTFTGWDATFTNITESYDVTAQYEINTYTITFKDWDNSVLKTDNVEYGSDATAPTDPVREGYTFTGWDTTFTNITESYDVTAQYEINTYTITFKDWDNSVLKRDNVEYDSDATAPDDPVRVGYTFSGWDTTFTNITESYDVTAQYEINTYTITFKDWDNSVLKKDTVEYGSDATAPTDPVRVGYTFTGWDTTFTNITESYDVTAQYEINTYTITFKDWDNSVLKRDTVEYGSDATAPDDPVREGYTFTGWDATFTNITESYDVTAQYKINTYTITFKDWDNSVLKRDNVEYDSDATAPTDPVRVGYTFTGWDTTFTNITESYDVTAEYEIISSVTETINTVFEVYPNPTNGMLYVSGKVGWQIQVFSLSGQFLQCLIMNNEKLQLDLSEYPEGMYLLKAGNESEQVLKKVIRR